MKSFSFWLSPCKCKVVFKTPGLMFIYLFYIIFMSISMNQFLVVISVVSVVINLSLISFLIFLAMKKGIVIHSEEEKENLLREIKKLKTKEAEFENQIELERKEGWAYYNIFDLLTRLDCEFQKVYRDCGDELIGLQYSDRSTLIFLLDSLCYSKKELLTILGPTTKVGQYILTSDHLLISDIYENELLLSLSEFWSAVENAANNLADFYVCSSNDDFESSRAFGLMYFKLPQDVLEEYFDITDLDE